MTLSSCNLVLAVLLLLIISVTAVTVSQPWQCDSENCRRYELRELFEEALVSSSDALWQLQQIYFDPSSDQSPASVNLSVWITVNDVNESDTLFSGCGHAFQYDCSNSSANSSHCKNGQWEFVSNYQILHTSSDSSHITRLIITSFGITILYIFDPSFYAIMKTLSSSIEQFLPNAHGISKIIKMHINTTLQENVCWDDATSALKMVLMWVKAYARANGIPIEKQDKDRSIVRNWSILCSENQVTGYNEGPFTNTCNTPITLFGIFALANLLVLTLTSLNIRKSFLWLKRQGKQAKILYKASAIVLTFVNIITLISDIAIVISNVRSTNSKFYYVSYSMPMIVKIPIVLLILIPELIVTCFSTHETNQIRRCTRQRFSHAFDFCQIIWFVHRLVNDVIISVVFFVIAPTQTLGIDALLLVIIGSAIAFLAIIIHKGSDGCNKQLCSFSVCIALNGLIIFGLLLAVIWVFVILIDNGLRSAGMGGLILSLVPPVTVSIVGYIVKEKYFKWTSSDSAMSEQLLQEMNKTTPIQNIDDEAQDTQEITPLLHSQR